MIHTFSILKHKNRIINVALIGIVLWTLSQRLPGILHQYRSQGTQSPSFSVPLLGGESYESETDRERRIIVFWATWCGPCKVELNRLQTLIDDGELNPQAIVAVSSYEAIDVVEKEVKELGYTFSVGLDPNGHAARKYNGEVTPTILFKDADGAIAWMTSGISPTLTFRVKRFLTH